MNGGIGAMNGTRCRKIEAFARLALEEEAAPTSDAARQRLLRLLRRALREELTPKQRAYLTAYVFDGENIVQIARREGVNKTTVWRTILRAQHNLRRQLKYAAEE